MKSFDELQLTNVSQNPLDWEKFGLHATGPESRFVDAVMKGDPFVDERLLTAMLPDSGDDKPGFLTSVGDFVDLEKMGVGDSISISISADVGALGKTVGGGGCVDVQRVDDGFKVTLSADLGAGFVKSMDKKISLIGKGEVSLSALMGAEGSVTLHFNNVSDVKKACTVFGKMAVTSSVATAAGGPLAPAVAYGLYKQGSQLPVLGKYFVSEEDLKALHFKVDRVELDPTLAIQAGLSAEMRPPLGDLKTLIKGAANIGAEAKFKETMAIHFDEGPAPVCVTGASIKISGDAAGKIGIGRYNNISNVKGGLEGEVSVTLERHTPLLSPKHVGGSQNPFKSLADWYLKTEEGTTYKIKFESDTKNFMTQTGQNKGVTIQSKKVVDVLKPEGLRCVLEENNQKQCPISPEPGVLLETTSYPYSIDQQSYSASKGFRGKASVSGKVVMTNIDKNGDNGVI